MKHRASTGSRAGRTSRLGLTALVTLALVAGGTGSVASGEPDSVVEQASQASTQPAAQEDATADVAPAIEDEVPAEETAPTAEATAPDVQDPAATAGTTVPAAEETVPADGGAAPAAEQAPAAPTTARPDARTVAPLAVPRPSGSSAVITVKVGGDRTTTSAVAPLAGVRLRLHDGGATAPTSPVAASWATCVSDAQGDCSFVVPQTQQAVYRNGRCVSWEYYRCTRYEQVLDSPAGVNRDRQFWVVQESAPTGWYTSSSLVTGRATSQQATPYRFRTGNELRAGATYTAGSHFMAGSGNSNATVSAGRWQVSRNNPQLPQTCEGGIDVALVLDLSGSVADAGAVKDLKSSAKAFVDALQGTGSRIALFTFADTAPRSTTVSGQNYPDLIAVDGNRSRIHGRIDGYSAEGGTNWDRGIHQVAADKQDFDLAIVITDGLATFSGSPTSGPGNYTRLVETEQAIFSANALKGEGTRVLAVGVGDGMSGAPHNLRAVSGPTGYVPGASANSADYFQTGWRQLAPLLQNLAKGATCQATLTVDKVADPYGGRAGPGAGWAFSATRTGGSGTLTANGAQVTGPSGSLGYTVQFSRPDATAATVLLEERITSGQRAEGWGLSGVSCVANGRPVTATRASDGVSLRVAVGDDITCTFTNTQTRESGVEIVKRAWAVPSALQLTGAHELSPGSAVTSGSTITWTYTVRNTGQTALADVTVTDDQGVTVTCPSTSLAVGEEMVCTGSGPVTARP